MAEFKVGDKVVRQEHYRDGQWAIECAQSDVAVDAVLEVAHVFTDDIRVKGLPWEWDASCFRRADAAELELAVPAPDHGDSPSYDLLATISRLESSVEHYREHTAELERDLDTRSQQLDVAMHRNNTLADQLDDLRAQLDFSVTLVQESDAAGAAAAEADLAAAKAHAKQLATDLEYSRHSWRLAQYHLTQSKAVLGGVACTLHTVNLGELASQLRDVAAGLESIDNGADAALVRRAGNLLDLFNMAIVDGKRQ